jgi:hypothetical protein
MPDANRSELQSDSIKPNETTEDSTAKKQSTQVVNDPDAGKRGWSASDIYLRLTLLFLLICVWGPKWGWWSDPTRNWRNEDVENQKRERRELLDKMKKLTNDEMKRDNDKLKRDESDLQSKLQLKLNSLKLPVFTKPAAATDVYYGKDGTYRIWMIKQKWQRATDKLLDAEEGWNHVNGQILASVFYLRPDESLEKLDGAFKDAIKEAGLNINELAEHSINRQERIVNGTVVRATTVEKTSGDIKLIQLIYGVSHKRGQFLIVTSVLKEDFEKMKPEMEEFMNGFEIIEPK